MKKVFLVMFLLALVMEPTFAGVSSVQMTNLSPQQMGLDIFMLVLYILQFFVSLILIILPDNQYIIFNIASMLTSLGLLGYTSSKVHTKELTPSFVWIFRTIALLFFFPLLIYQLYKPNLQSHKDRGGVKATTKCPEGYKEFKQKRFCCSEELEGGKCKGKMVFARN
eukprot:c16271_g1_i1.p1 GENE.c16271_g1_i1~~c16271_g1_i1.p1  ORF type:complete len:182 (-),score=23.72 c16271_g1_i1:378-878(-)